VAAVAAIASVPTAARARIGTAETVASAVVAAAGMAGGGACVASVVVAAVVAAAGMAGGGACVASVVVAAVAGAVVASSGSVVGGLAGGVVGLGLGVVALRVVMVVRVGIVVCRDHRGLVVSDGTAVVRCSHVVGGIKGRGLGENEQLSSHDRVGAGEVQQDIFLDYGYGIRCDNIGDDAAGWVLVGVEIASRLEFGKRVVDVT